MSGQLGIQFIVGRGDNDELLADRTQRALNDLRELADASGLTLTGEHDVTLSHPPAHAHDVTPSSWWRRVLSHPIKTHVVLPPFLAYLTVAVEPA